MRRAKAKKPDVVMDSERASLFAKSTRTVDYEFKLVGRRVTRVVDGHLIQTITPLILATFKRGDKCFSMLMEPEDSYEIGSAFNRAYDAATGA